MNDVFFRGNSPEELLETLDEILTHLESDRPFVGAHEYSFSATEIAWCGKLHSADQISHNPERIQGLATMHRSRMTGVDAGFLGCQ